LGGHSKSAPERSSDAWKDDAGTSLNLDLEAGRGNSVSGKAKIEAGKCIRSIRLRMCKTRLRRRFIHGASGGCKVRVKPGSHHRSAVDAQGPGKPGNANRQQRRGSYLGRPARVTLKASRRRSRESKEPGRLGELNLGTAEGSRGSGAIRKESIRGVTARARNRGNPKIQTR